MLLPRQRLEQRECLHGERKKEIPQRHTSPPLKREPEDHRTGFRREPERPGWRAASWTIRTSHCHRSSTGGEVILDCPDWWNLLISCPSGLVPDYSDWLRTASDNENAAATKPVQKALWSTIADWFSVETFPTSLEKTFPD